MQIGDIVGNLRLDQAWGGAQLMGALHEVNANYYTATVPGRAVILATSGASRSAVAFGSTSRRSPRATTSKSQVNYTQGALRYLFFTPNSDWAKSNGNSASLWCVSDAVYGLAGSSVELTTAWGVNASYEHYWTPQWHESFFGGYYAVSYDNTANTILCFAETGGTGGGVSRLRPLLAGAPGSCNNNWSVWYAGSRLQWDVTKTFYLGVEALYDQLESATPTGGSGGASARQQHLSSSGATFQESQQGNWAVTFRAHKDFLP